MALLSCILSGCMKTVSVTAYSFAIDTIQVNRWSEQKNRGMKELLEQLQPSSLPTNGNSRDDYLCNVLHSASRWNSQDPSDYIMSISMWQEMMVCRLVLTLG